MSENQEEYWAAIEQLVNSSNLVIDRAKGSRHPRYAEIIYPVDYGYLEGTTAVDGGGIDVWIGERGAGEVQGVLCSVDLFKRDAEIKIIMGCTEEELGIIEQFLNQGSMRAIMVRR